MTARPDAKKEFRILGPLEVRENGDSLPVGSGKQRALLALLLLNAREVVSTDHLIDALWGEAPPASAANSVHVYVSHLRKVLGARLVTRGHGYALMLEPGELDLERFEQLLDEGRNLLTDGHADAAAETLAAGLALWRGPPLVDFANAAFAQHELLRLEHLRLGALEARVEADLALGRHSELVGELDALTRANPLHERFWAQLMVALYRSGRQAEALDAYQRARRTLAAEVGLAPGPELQRLEKAILAQDPSLELDAAATRRPSAVRTRPPRRRSLVAGALAAGALAGAATAAVLLTRDSPPAPLAAISPDSIGIVDPHRNALVDELPLHTTPAAIAYGAGSVWVASYDRETLLRLDPNTHEVTQTLGLGAVPTAIAIGGGYVWVLCSRNAKLLIQFDADTGALAAKHALTPKIPVGRGLPVGRLGFENDEPVDVAATRDAAWVAYPYEVLRVDASTGAVKHIRAGAAGGVAADERAVWSEGQLWSDTPGRFFRIQPRTAAIARRVAEANVGIGSGAGGLAADATGVWAAVRTDMAWKVDAALSRVTLVTRLHHTPIDVAIGEGAVWTANVDGTVSRVDRRTGNLVATIPLGKYPRIAYPVQLAVGSGAVWIAVH